MQKSVGIIVIGLLAITLPAPVGANHDADCTTDAAAVALGPIYVSPQLYIYQESNEQAGLQRGGENSALGEALTLDPDGFPLCGHPDTIIF